MLDALVYFLFFKCLADKSKEAPQWAGVTVHRLRDLLALPFYKFSVVASIFITFGLTFGVLYAINFKQPSHWELFGPWSLMGVVGAHVAIPILLPLSSTRNIKKQIFAGRHPVLAPEALQSNAFLRYVLFSMAEPNIRRRRWLFVLNTLVMPGCIIATALAVACWATLDFTTHCCERRCKLPLLTFVGITSAWTTVSVLWVFTANYFAVHNAAQPDIAAYLQQCREADLREDGRDGGDGADNGGAPSPVTGIVVDKALGVNGEHINDGSLESPLYAKRSNDEGFGSC